VPIPVEAYTNEGAVRGIVAASGHIRDVVETETRLTIERATWSDGRAAGSTNIEIDDLLIVPLVDDPSLPVHATWHPLRLEVGPYVVTGEMPTLPGFDPDRALARPTGSFVMLRTVEVLDRQTGEPIAAHVAALVNRYAVERFEAGLMLGFFFPGAHFDAPPAEESAES
jgi:hypothetical protein